MSHIGAFLWLFSVSRAWRFGVVRVIFGIPKRVNPLCFSDLVGVFFFFVNFLGADVFHN